MIEFLGLTADSRLGGYKSDRANPLWVARNSSIAHGSGLVGPRCRRQRDLLRRSCTGAKEIAIRETFLYDWPEFPRIYHYR
jgi:hypothetical protein